MYLLTFALLVIGLLSIYTKVLAVETARFYQSQSGIGKALLDWHSAAVSLAGNVVSPFPGTTGCGLTPGVAVPVACTTGGSVATNPAGLGTVTVNPPKTYTYPAGYSYPHLAPGYSNYTWKSIAYTDAVSNGFYVITYVDPPAADGFVQTAAGISLGITEADLFRQIKNLGIPLYAYGGVQGGVVKAPPVYTTIPSTINISYTVPNSAINTPIQDGSFALISTVAPCIGC